MYPDPHTIRHYLPSLNLRLCVWTQGVRWYPSLIVRINIFSLKLCRHYLSNLIPCTTIRTNYGLDVQLCPGREGFVRRLLRYYLRPSHRDYHPWSLMISLKRTSLRIGLLLRAAHPWDSMPWCRFVPKQASISEACVFWMISQETCWVMSKSGSWAIW